MSDTNEFYAAAFGPIIAFQAREQRPEATETWPELLEAAYGALGPMTASAWTAAVERANSIMGRVQS